MAKSKLMQVLTRYHSIIIAAFLLLTAGMAYPAILYFSATTLDIAPPKGSQSAASAPVVKQVFPNITDQQAYVIMIDDTHNARYGPESKICDDAALADKLENFTNRVREISMEIEYFLYQNDYFTAKKSYPLVKDQFCIAQTFIIQIGFDNRYDDINTAPKLSKRFHSVFKELFSEYDFLELYEVNEGLLSDDSSSGTAQDLLKLDTISITCGLIIVGLYLRSFKFLIISLVNLAISFVLSFALSYFISFGISIATFAPSVQSSALVALTFDYCLFLFSRLQSELKNGKNGYQAIQSMLEYSGHVVIVSGGCLSLVFLFLLICPVQLIQSIGLASALSICMLMLVNTINTAAILMAFPRFFMKSDYPFACLDVIIGKTKKWKNYGQSEEGNQLLATLTVDQLDENRDSSERVTSKASKIIYKVLEYITSHIWVMILLLLAVFALSLSFIPAFVKMEYSMDLQQAMPRKSGTVKGMNRLGQVTSPGIVTPFYIVLNKTQSDSTTEPQTDTLLNDQAFTLTQSLIADLLTNSSEYFPNVGVPDVALTSSQVISPCFFQTNYSKDMIIKGRKSGMGAIMFLLNQTVPYVDNISTFSIMLTPGIPLTGKHSELFVPWIRERIDIYRQQFTDQGIQLSEYSKQTMLVDSVFGLFDSFPLIIGVSFSVMFLILAFTFRSLMAPLCFLVEVVLAMIFFYGVATHLFQFDHVNGDDAIFWATILIMFSIAIGLCTDYYVFRFSGIYNEFTANGNARQAVMDASENMSVVMTAGLIMIISFSGLLFSGLDMLLQFGVCLVVSLAFDTLLVVPVLVPSVTVLAGKFMFWPGNFWHKKKQGAEVQVFE